MHDKDPREDKCSSDSIGWFNDRKRHYFYINYCSAERVFVGSSSRFIVVGWSGDAARMPLGLAEHGIIYMLNKMILYSTYLVLSTIQSTLPIQLPIFWKFWSIFSTSLCHTDKIRKIILPSLTGWFCQYQWLKNVIFWVEITLVISSCTVHLCLTTYNGKIHTSATALNS